MSSQAKKNRRNIPSNKVAASATQPVTQTTPIQTEPVKGSLRSAPKPAAISTPNYPYLMKDLTWTGIVAGLVILLLILSYFLFR